MYLSEVLVSVSVFSLLAAGSARLTWSIFKGAKQSLTFVRETNEIVKTDLTIRKAIKNKDKERTEDMEEYSLKKKLELEEISGLKIIRTEKLCGKDGKVKGLEVWWIIGEAEYVTQELF